METAEKIFLGFTVVAVVSTIFTSPYASGIFGNIAGGISKIYGSVKH